MALGRGQQQGAGLGDSKRKPWDQPSGHGRRSKPKADLLPLSSLCAKIPLVSSAGVPQLRCRNLADPYRSPHPPSCWKDDKPVCKSLLQPSTSFQHPPAQQGLCWASLGRGTPEAGCRRGPAAPRAGSFPIRVVLSHQDLTLVDPSSYSDSLIAAFPSFSISSACRPPTSRTALPGKAGWPPCRGELASSLLCWGEKLARC